MFPSRSGCSPPGLPCHPDTGQRLLHVPGASSEGHDRHPVSWRCSRTSRVLRETKGARSQPHGSGGSQPKHRGAQRASALPSSAPPRPMLLLQIAQPSTHAQGGASAPDIRDFRGGGPQRRIFSDNLTAPLSSLALDSRSKTNPPTAPSQPSRASSRVCRGRGLARLKAPAPSRASLPRHGAPPSPLWPCLGTQLAPGASSPAIRGPILTHPFSHLLQGGLLGQKQ